MVYVGSNDNRVYALDASTGDLIWSYETGDDGVFSSPAVSGGVVYVGSRDNRVYALDASTGDLIWSYGTGACGVVIAGRCPGAWCTWDRRTTACMRWTRQPET